MKKSEQTLVGIMLLAGSAALIGTVGLNQWDAFNNAQSQISSLTDEIKGLDAQKLTLNADIAEMEKNSSIPSDVEVLTYTEKNREQIIKGMLDKVVNLATGAGNLFISLAPSDVKDEPAPPPPPPTAKPAAATDATTTADGKPAEPEPVQPVLNTFDYDVSVRGTYGTIQAFLKAVATQKSLMEIHTIKLENEVGSTAVTTDTTDPFHPIRMTAQIRLALQPTDK